jgi:CubicO group peptidase (beta-lactamase class C family)
MKRSFFKTVASGALIAGISPSALQAIGTGQSSDHSSKPELKFREDGQFKIMQLTDVHYNNNHSGGAGSLELMQRAIRISLCLLVFATGISNAQNVPQKFMVAIKPESAGFDAARLQRIDSVMAFYVREGSVPNIVSFVARKGQIVHHKAYGSKDAENKVKTTDIFRWASQTKAVTSVVLLTLFEESKFLLDDPVEKYLPMFANPQVYVSGSVEAGDLITRPAKGKITIRHLLTHTSGYSYRAFGENLEVIRYGQPTTTKEAVERIARTPLMHDPGEKFTYGYSMDIAGYLAEAVTGKTLDVLMKERIFEPLGMNDTYFYLPPEKHNRLVKMYIHPAGQARCSVDTTTLEDYPLVADQPYHGGGAGLSGPIEDYAKFLQMILNKGTFNNHRILGRKTVELMLTNQITVENGYQFSLGFEILRNKEFLQKMVSPGSLRWGGAYQTQYVIDPKEELIILFYTNYKLGNFPVYDRYLISIYQALK